MKDRAATRRVMIGITFALVAIFVSAPTAFAGWLSYGSNGFCGPQGESYTRWGDFPPDAEGVVFGYLLYNNGGNWQTKDSVGTIGYGSSGDIRVNTFAGYIAGGWLQRGYHSHDPAGLNNVISSDYFNCGGPY